MRLLMSSAALRLDAANRWSCETGARESVEILRSRISRLQSERQQLRERAAARGELERNRIELARCQWDLAHALIERYLPHS